jgi:hypothetical protein
MNLWILNMGSVNAEVKFRWTGSRTGNKDLRRKCPELNIDPKSTWLPRSRRFQEPFLDLD